MKMDLASFGVLKLPKKKKKRGVDGAAMDMHHK
jgi:hypothetical protein